MVAQRSQESPGQQSRPHSFNLGDRHHRDRHNHRPKSKVSYFFLFDKSGNLLTFPQPDRPVTGDFGQEMLVNFTPGEIQQGAQVTPLVRMEFIQRLRHLIVIFRSEQIKQCQDQCPRQDHTKRHRRRQAPVARHIHKPVEGAGDHKNTGRYQHALEKACCTPPQRPLKRKGDQRFRQNPGHVIGYSLFHITNPANFLNAQCSVATSTSNTNRAGCPPTR